MEQTTTQQNPQVSGTVTPELYADIKNFAEKDKHSMSKMVAILLESAVKARKRKR